MCQSTAGCCGFVRDPSISSVIIVIIDVAGRSSLRQSARKKTKQKNLLVPRLARAEKLGRVSTSFGENLAVVDVQDEERTDSGYWCFSQWLETAIETAKVGLSLGGAREPSLSQLFVSPRVNVPNVLFPSCISAMQYALRRARGICRSTI